MPASRTLCSITLLLAALALTACATIPARQTSGDETAASAFPTGTLEGTVKDPDGRAVGGAHITVRHSGSGRKWTARADMEGIFLLMDIPAQEGYSVTVSTPPFWTITLKDVAVRAGASTDLTVVRRLGSKGGPLTPAQPGS